MLIPIILCGGVGSRLWPVSRKMDPKQFHCLTNGATLLQNTVARARLINDTVAPLVLCQNEHRFLVAQQLAQLDVVPRGILLEPVMRNTAPAITVAALNALTTDENAVIAVFPADHIIGDDNSFVQNINTAYGLALEGHLVTFGVYPNRAETGYGYIKANTKNPLKGEKAYRIEAFTEKPDAHVAQTFVESGDYYWNSGIFVMAAQSYLDELQNYSPQVLHHSRVALENASYDLDFLRLDEKSFEQCPNISIDCAVMEHTNRGVVIPLDTAWSDIGSWDGLWDFSDKDAENNVVSGQVITQDVQASYLRSDHRLLVALGVSDLNIVDTKDALLVAGKGQAESLKQVVEKLARDQCPQVTVNVKVSRPWGYYEGLAETELFQVKRLCIDPGAKISLQKHRYRSEHWVVVSGVARVTHEQACFDLHQNQSTYIPANAVHQLENAGNVPLEIIEIQTGSYFGEDDIERLEDNYGRV